MVMIRCKEFVHLKRRLKGWLILKIVFSFHNTEFVGTPDSIQLELIAAHFFWNVSI